MELKAELDRRYREVRVAMGDAGLDALVVSGSAYTGFEGAVTYLSGFQLVHRYAYVVVPVDGDPYAVFPTEARYVGEHDATLVEQVFAEHPGEQIAQVVRERGWRRVGVYGLDYVMTVRDYTALAGVCEPIPFDIQFDLARAVKSDAELTSVRDSVRINTEGFHVFRVHFAPGKAAADVMAPAERYFVEQGCSSLRQNMVLVGMEFALAGKHIHLGDFCLPSLEVAGPGGHWAEISRALGRKPDGGPLTGMLEGYAEYYDAAKSAMRPGATAHDVHRAVSKGFLKRGFGLGHVTGHSIGMTMIEHPKIGEGVDVQLRENMVFSMHPHVIAPDGRSCLYMQETWLVGADGGEPLSGLPMEVFPTS